MSVQDNEADRNQSDRQNTKKTKKKYDPIEDYQENYYLDCKDSINAWCLARIIERCDHDQTLKINFDGWSHKWDEWVRFSSSKIAPFRKYSQGYTGQTKFAIRDWNLDLEELAQRTKRLKDITDSKFESLKSCVEITQLIRGAEYVYLDSLLQHDFENPKEELPVVFQYFDQYFKLYITFLNMLPDYLPDYFEGLANLDAFLTNERVAIAHCLYELGDSFNKILGSSDRLSSHFLRYDSAAYDINICDKQTYAGKDILLTWTADKEEASDEIPRRRKYSKMLAQLVNRFGELGGFDAWLGIACYFKEDNGNVLIPPFKMFKTLISNISNILIFLNKDLQGQLMPKIKVQIEQRLKYISDKEIKDLDKEILTQFIQRCQALLIHYLPKEEVFLMTEMAELDIALRFLTCPYFEKRLKGINEIKDLTEKIDVYEQIARTGANYNHFVGKATRYISAKVFIEWVEKNKIFELILGDSLHVEIIKRTHEIIKFIAKYEKIPLSLLDLLWKSCEGKHEATLIGMYDLITEIADSLDKEGIDFLKNKIESIPDEEQNEMTLKLIKGFAINTLPKLSDIIDGKVDEANMQMESYNCVGCLWRLMLDESKVTSTLSEIALNSLAAIIKERTCHPLKKIFLYKCFEKIQQRDSVSQCIHLIHSILTNGYYQHKFDNEYSLTKILEDLDAKFDLLDLMINEFVDFYKLAGSNIKKSGQEITDEIRSKPWNGKYSYGINFSNRLIFLEYLITNQCYDMFFDVPKIEKLWDLVIMQPNFNFDKDYFFSWVSRKQELLRFPETALLFAKDDLPDFFEKIICNSKKLDFVTLSAEGFDCFSIFFNIVNEQEGKLKTIKSNKLQMLSLDYSGKETLWNMFLECKNEATLLKIVNLLCETNLRLSPMLEENKKQVMEEFTLKAVNLMKEGYAQKNENYITKSVLILMHFFDRFEGKNRLVQKKEDNNRYGHSIVISVIQKPDNISKNIVIGIYQTLGSLRKKIADAFGLEIHEYKLFTKGNLMDHEEDDTQILQLAFHGPFVIYQIASNKANEEFHPKEIIANNSENIDLLFKLLSEDIQAVGQVWDLLMRLPLNEKLRNSLYDANETWDKLLDASHLHVYRLLYCLQIVEGFLIETEQEKNDPINITEKLAAAPFKDIEWANKFFKTGGLQTLAFILQKLDLATSKNPIAVRCITIILRILCYYFVKLDISAFFENKDEPEAKFISRIIELLNGVCQYTIYRESKETDADRENQPVVKILNKVTKDYIKIPENHFNESQLLYYAQSIFLLAIQRKPALLQNIYKFSSLNELLVVGLIQTDNLHLKEKLSHGLLTLLIQNQLHDITPKPHEFFVPVLLGEALDHALGNQERSSVFFKLIINIINHIDISQVNLDIDKLLQRLVNFVKDRKPTERSQKDTDIILFGILQILRSLFMRFPQKANRYGQDEKLVSELLQCCLFEIPRRVNKKDIPGPKCKSHETRYAAFKLLIELGKGDNENLKDIINFIWPIHKTGKWRTKRMVDWSITPKDNEKSSTGYVGLKNLACICYMNSTIQQLYMIPSFRKAVLEVEDKAYATTAKEDNLLHQLKCIFVALNESEKQYFNPKGFCHAFKDWDGNPTNVFEQMDADEFLNMFLDRLENLVKGTKQQHFIKNLFGGCVSNELICKGCPHYSEREEPFTTISLQVKNKKSIFQSLNAFIEGEMLEGENAYMCSTCNKKVNTLKRTCLKKLPNHLIIVMKRFEFDYETMVKMKLNDYCEFPNKLNLEPYTQQGLRKAEKAKKAEKDGGADQGGDQQPTNEKEYPASYFEYKLHGVVIHLGTADMGHYYSLIQDRELPDVPEDKKWYEFNDTLVSRFDPKDIASEAFGGEEKWRYYSSDNMGGSIKEKIKNAYLLIYERINPIDPEEPQAQPEPEQKSKKAEESKEDSETTVQTEKKIDSGEKAIVSETQPATQEIKEEEDPLKNVPKEFLQSLLEKNQLFHINRFVFSREYMDFIGDLFQQREYTPNYNFVSISSMDPKTQSKEFYDAQLIKVGVVFLLTTVLREQGRHGIISLLPRLKKVLSENLPACLWLIESFTNKKILQEFIMDCPVGDMRKFVVGLVICAFRTVYEYEIKDNANKMKETNDSGFPTTFTANFVNCIISHIFEAKQKMREYTEFFRLISEIVSVGPEIAVYMVSKQVIGRFMDFFFEAVSPLNDYFRDMSDVPYIESPEADLGTSQEEKIRVRSSWEELLLRRNNKQQMESHMAHKAYMWKAMSILIRYCRLNPSVQRNQAQIGKYDLQLNSNERTLLTPEAKFVEKVINDATQKIGFRALADAYSYLSYEDPKITYIFTNAIKNGLSEGDYVNMKAYFRCFLTLLKVNDSLTESRTKDLLTFFTNLMEENRNYFVEMDNYTTFLVKMITRIEHARKWFLANTTTWNWVINWILNNPTPPMGMVPGQVRLQKRRTQMGYGMLQYDLQEYRSRSMIKANKLKDFLDQKPVDNNNAWDSDEDLSEHQFQIGEKIDIDPMSNNRWTTGEVETLLGEMINISYQENEKGPNKTWTATDAENIAPYRAQQGIQEEVQAMTKSFYQSQQSNDEENQGFVAGGMDAESGNSDFYDGTDDDTAL